MSSLFHTSSAALRTLAMGLGLGLLASCGGGGSGSTANTNTDNAQSMLQKRRSTLASALGKPARFLVGLGTVGIADVQKQKLTPDIYDQYLNGVGAGSWPTYTSVSGAYVQAIAQDAEKIGAMPMYTLYQMASNGDGNLSNLSDPTFMTQYWDNVRLLFTQLKIYGKPALVNLEPDFWGYAQRLNGDPTRQGALVASTSGQDCAGLSNDLVGVAACLVKMARTYAPNAYIGFPPSTFDDLLLTELSYMKRIGADKADFVVITTLDRDIGCIEAAYAPASCNRAQTTRSLKRWDENNLVSPHFKDHFRIAQSYAEGLQLPLLWWQTPLGAPSDTPGGRLNAWRDNRARYFLTHTAEMVAAGGIGIVFSPGDTAQTNINTDGGQFKALSSAYFAKPTALP